MPQKYMKPEHSPAQRFLYYPPVFFPSSEIRETGPRRLISHRGTPCFNIRHFIWLYWLSFYALLHPDSIKNELTALFQDWGPFCRWALCSTLWLMGSPGGLSEVSLKVWNNVRVRLQMHIGNGYFKILKCLFPKQNKWVAFKTDN